ncbi:hypothetical protein NECAME_04136 [Necator americanus]|uniref:Uncharacterized protein n=1 Tax=Necator americanus TaxID=51031 RepID=W2SZG7_NECAM|nr:hypothetical protein NECAME_04136 [Necator americanus]ETN74107.1 hypothetical protein NECAME_04136 [Necator americanus]
MLKDAYFSAKQKYSEAIAYAMTVGKFRNMAINAGVERGGSFTNLLISSSWCSGPMCSFDRDMDMV